ncbi:MAG: serine/threonine protein kinase [Myxococcales bacterium]|nr:serine/threonine protein kinase [Myxococcales bacterium]
MSIDPASTALSALTTALDGRPEVWETVRRRWREDGLGALSGASSMPENVRMLVDELGVALSDAAEADASALAELFDTRVGPALLAWCTACSGRRDLTLAPLLRRAFASGTLPEAALVDAVRARVVEGPLQDALACTPLLGTGEALVLPENAQALARLQLLLWEAGASALSVPELGPWLWGTTSTFEVMIHQPARGSLRGRVLAARCLEVGVTGMPATTSPQLVGRTLQLLQPLLLHPEPLVWVHAARALGRLTGPVEQLQGTLLDWVQGSSLILRQRAMTAFASLPAERFGFLAGQLIAIINSRDEEPWVLAAIAAATPYLFFERRDIWNRLAKRILKGDGGAITARALARGLGALFRRETRDPEIVAPLRALRAMARAARPTSLDEVRRWIEVTAVTDVLDAAERDPLDIELGIENLARLAAQYDDEEADGRAARFASSLTSTFHEAKKLALGRAKLRQRAAAVNAVEGAARTFALRLWAPMLATHPSGEALDEPNLDETWKAIAQAPAEILDLVKERRQGEGGADPEQTALPLEVLAVRLGGYALDACGEDAELGPGRGPTAHDTCLWLRKIEGLADGSRELSGPLKSALSALFWRLVDITRGTALGEVDDVRWLGPFAAWWGLIIDRPAMLLQLGIALPMMSPAALDTCCGQAEALRTAVASGSPDGAWGAASAQALAKLHAEDTELAHALAALAESLAAFGQASGPRADLDAMALELVLAGDRLHGALADPVKALHPATAGSAQDSLTRSATENAPRVAALVARAVRARELSMLDVWFASLGPVASALLEAAVRGAISRTPAPASPKKPERKSIEGYELIKPLGEGGIGTVWLVRKPGADRLFVLKIPKADALANATDVEREGILTSFVEEARVLAGLYHPNVANIIDRGVSNGVPFLVLEYLIGADLKEYASAGLMTLPELRQVVLDSCAGLSALHTAGLVHRDVKPANLWLRLPLAGGVRFDPAKHRDSSLVHPLATVVIDFGMVRATRVPADAGGRFVAGTAGYIAPEQVLDPVELDPRSDVYALAGTLYTVTTGRAFFDEIESQRDRIIAHMRRDPLEDASRLHPFPARVARLLRAATLRDPAHRPTPLEFGREFAASI